MREVWKRAYEREPDPNCEAVLLLAELVELTPDEGRQVPA